MLVFPESKLLVHVNLFIYLTTFSASDERPTAGNELDRIWKESVLTQFNVVSMHLPTTNNLSQNSWSPDLDLNPGTPKYEEGC